MKFIIMAFALMAMFSTASAQYTQYRLNVNKNGASSYWCLKEFEFYDQNDAKLTPNPSYGSAQTHYNGNVGAIRAFNEISNNDDIYYCSAHNNPTGWLAYDFKTPTKIIAYDLERLNRLKKNDPHAPVSWTFEGSHDGVDWVTLDTQNDVQWSATDTIDNEKFYLQGVEQKALFVGMGECPYNKQTGRVTTVTGTDPIEECRSSCFNNFQETYFSLYQDGDEMKCSCFEDCDQLAGLETAKTYEILSNHATALLLENDQSISQFAEDLYTCDNNLIQKGSELQTSQSSLSTCNTNLAQKTSDHATSQSSLTTTNSNLATMTDERDLWKNRFEAAHQYEQTARAGPSAQAKALQDFPDPEAAVGSGMVETSIGKCNSVMEKATFLAMGSLLGGVVVFLATKKQKNEESSALLETL